MYTKEDAEVHQKIMKNLAKSFKKPKTWVEFRKLQQGIVVLSVKVFDQASQNTQSSWENVFIQSCVMRQFQLILIARYGVTIQLKTEARMVLDELTKIIDQFHAKHEVALKTSKQFILNVQQQRYWLGRLKRAFRTERSPR